MSPNPDPPHVSPPLWSRTPHPQQVIDERILAFYGSEFDEADRLVARSGQGVLEFERTQRIVRDLVPAGSRIIDIGGATGVHAATLAERGDDVLLVDPVPEQVAAAAAVGTFRAVVGDARRLDAPDDSFDAALLLGPLYHLLSRQDRLHAWSEARRVVRPGGYVFGAAVSRLGATAWVTVLQPAAVREPGAPVGPSVTYPEAWRALAEDGTGGFTASGFPGAHFHVADELEQEARQGGLQDVRVVGLEGPAGQALEITRTLDPTLVDAARTLAEAFSEHRSVRDLSPHLLAIGRVPD